MIFLLSCEDDWSRNERWCHTITLCRVMLSQLCHTITSFNNLPKLCHVERHFALIYISPSDFFHIRQEQQIFKRSRQIFERSMPPYRVHFYNSVCKLSVDTDSLTNMFSSKCVQIFWVHSLMNMFFSRCVQIFWVHCLFNEHVFPRRITKTKIRIQKERGFKEIIHLLFIWFQLR